MSDEDFETDHGRRGGRGGAAAPEQGIPRWQSHPPPGLRQYLEHQRASMGQGAVPQQPPADAPAAVVDGMEQALDAMERALEEQISWKSSIMHSTSRSSCKCRGIFDTARVAREAKSTLSHARIQGWLLFWRPRHLLWRQSVENSVHLWTPSEKI